MRWFPDSRPSTASSGRKSQRRRQASPGAPQSQMFVDNDPDAVLPLTVADANPDGQLPRSSSAGGSRSKSFWSSLQEFLLAVVSVPPSVSEHRAVAVRQQSVDSPVRRLPSLHSGRSSPLVGASRVGAPLSLLPDNGVTTVDDAMLVAPATVTGEIPTTLHLPLHAFAASAASVDSRASSFSEGKFDVGNDIVQLDVNDTSDGASDDPEPVTAQGEQEPSPTWANLDSRFLTPFFTSSRNLVPSSSPDSHDGSAH
jgi:type IV secretory pathway VirJ component